MHWLDDAMLDALIARAAQSPRRRQHHNLHSSYTDPCQRLLNALWHDSYIAPHCHALDPKEETLVAVRGELGCIAFDANGAVTGRRRLSAGGRTSAVIVSPGEWHTVVALSETAVLLEIKAGPFHPSAAKETAQWAAAEDSAGAMDYLRSLQARFA